MAMLLPQNAANNKTDSSLSISMHPPAPGTSRQPFLKGFALRIAAGAPLLAGLAMPGFAKPSDGGEFAVAAAVPYWTGFVDWVTASYAQAPALVLGLAALIAVAPLALVGRWVARRDVGSVSVSEARTQVRRVRRGMTAEPRDGIKTGHIPLRPLAAWVEVVNRNEVAPTAPDKRYGLVQPLLRIGRETDNDICLEDMTVHRYHAAIHRTEDAEFVITDLSSSGGNGVVVNGRAVSEARLTSGDLIELGNAKLKFSAGLAGTA